jgi:DNA-binding response OmpR family regulator
MIILDTTKVDMILLDMEMPKVSGLDFLKQLRKSPAFYHIPVIIVSSHGTADIIISAKKTGAKDFVVKPINPKTLLEKVHAAFKISPQRISRESLLKQLAILEIACRQGKSARVEETIGVLEQVYYNMSADKLIGEICRHARGLDYNLAAEKVAYLLSAKLYDDEKSRAPR